MLNLEQTIKFAEKFDLSSSELQTMRTFHIHLQKLIPKLKFEAYAVGVSVNRGPEIRMRAKMYGSVTSIYFDKSDIRRSTNTIISTVVKRITLNFTHVVTDSSMAFKDSSVREALSYAIQADIKALEDEALKNVTGMQSALEAIQKKRNARDERNRVAAIDLVKNGLQLYNLSKEELCHVWDEYQVKYVTES